MAQFFSIIGRHLECAIQTELVVELEGNIRTISPGRNRVNFQILAYLLTIDLLYGTGCLSY